MKHSYFFSYWVASLCWMFHVQGSTGLDIANRLSYDTNRKSASIISQLPLNDINIVTVTDVHSWVTGHGNHKQDLNADYGHVLSFYQRLQEICRSEGRDLFLVMNGDFMDGTGLTTNPPTHLIPILRKMPWDAVNVGNHELYKKSTIDYISSSGGFVEHLAGRYLTSNVRHSDTGEYIGSKARFMKGEHGSIVLTFGFLYDMMNEDESAVVDKVEEVVKKSWFIDLLHEKFDAIVVLAHMDVNDPLAHIILKAIRAVCGEEVPVQFVTGHTHYRGFKQLDNKSVSFEAGHYLDTVGFISFSKRGEFQHVFIDSNIETLSSIVSTKESNLLTTDGKELSDLIHKTQEDVGLLDVFGCSPQNFYRNRTLDQPDSLFALYLNDIVAEFLFEGNSSKILVQARGDFRYDLFSGPVTMTDLISVSPFGDQYNLIAPHIQGSKIDALVSNLNSESKPPIDSIFYAVDQIKRLQLPNFFRSGGILNERDYYDIYTADFVAKTVATTLENIIDTNESLSPKLAYPLTDNSNIWIDFIGKNWQCAFVKNGEKSKPKINVGRVFFAIILFGGGSALFGFVLCKFSSKRVEESNVNVETSVNGEAVEDYDTMERPLDNIVV